MESSVNDKLSGRVVSSLTNNQKAILTLKQKNDDLLNVKIREIIEEFNARNNTLSMFEDLYPEIPIAVTAPPSATYWVRGTFTIGRGNILMGNGDDSIFHVHG